METLETSKLTKIETVDEEVVLDVGGTEQLVKPHAVEP